MNLKRLTSAALIALLVIGCGGQEREGDGSMGTVLPNFDTLWNYDEPAATRAKFEAILPQAEKSGDQTYHLQLLTQIARTYGLEAKFDSAHQLLDRVERELTPGPPEVQVRYLLERGRTFNSSGDPAAGKRLFQEAFRIAKSNGMDFFAIDAAHMVAITATAPEDKRNWNLRGIDIASKSSDNRARNWRGSLCNNMGWDYHDAGEYDQALVLFQNALEARVEQGDEKNIDIARWCIARCLRSLERYDESLKIQEELLKKYDQSGDGDGYVFEELGELYLIKGEKQKAAGYFAKAYELLSQDVWLQRNEQERLARLKELGGVE